MGNTKTDEKDDAKAKMKVTFKKPDPKPERPDEPYGTGGAFQITPDGRRVRV